VHVETDTDIIRLQTVLRDLVALSAIPAAWAGREPPAVAAGLADALVALLQLDFAFVRLSGPGGGGTVYAARGSAWKRFPEWLERYLAERVEFAGRTIVADVGEGSGPCRGVVIPIGVNRDGGLVAAASARSDFPTAIEQLLLSLAANQAATDFENARLIQELRTAEEELRAARDELEAKVAERTVELHLANDELSALRRVATLVAKGVRPEDLFAVVAEEIARVVDAPLVRVARYEADDTATECASFSTQGLIIPLGKRSSLAGMSVPLVVGGRVWGAVVASSTERLADGTEGRLAEFTEILAIAIANAESREALGRLADEQATLLRLATMVAQGAPPADIFSAVSEEAGRLMDSDAAAVARFEYDPPAIVVVAVGQSISEIPIGTRWELDDALASTEVFRTGRPARIDARDWASVAGPVHERGGRLGLSSTVASPIIVEGRVWGTISLSSKASLPLDTGQRLEKFSRLVATAIANADSRSELAASRRRIVAASDDARRRIERDLHDGTQQRLVSLGLAVRAAEADVPADMGSLRAELSSIATGLVDTAADLHELSRGIHPAILSRGGLGPALRTLARRSTIPVALEVTTDTRLPEPIEVAAYFIASEALANATKHAQASRIEITLAASDGGVLLSVRDDGVGGADPAGGSGLVGLSDRVEALGGSIRVRSSPGDGTHITAVLPLERDAESR
jgi:signal transduction histidine kinase